MGTVRGQQYRCTALPLQEANMRYKWRQLDEGIRVREHPTRRHGIKPDAYFVIRYQIDGKRQEEALGWANQGMTLAKARLELARLKESARTGRGETSLRARRKAAMQAREEAEKAQKLAANATVTFAEFWCSTYWPGVQHMKTPASLQTEAGLFNNWICPILGEVPLQSLVPGQAEAVARNMLKHGRAPRTAQYALAIISQVWNTAYGHGILSGENPVRRTKKPKLDNRRMRFLTPQEARLLLSAIKKRSQSLYDSCLLSLFCGLRAGEIHALRWADINLTTGEISVRDPKNGYNRHVYMTAEIQQLLRRRYAGQGRGELLLPGRNGKMRSKVSDLFARCVNELGLNDGIDDRRLKVVFHTLRHTFASWHVERGTPLFQVGTLMGHRTVQMTQRYSHLSPDSARKAAMTLEGVLTA